MLVCIYHHNWEKRCTYDQSFYKTNITHTGKSQPNGGDWQQCIQTRFSEEELVYDDLNCSEEVDCSACQITTQKIFKLRGNIPPNTEREYFVGLGMTSKSTKIRGFKETKCIWNNGTWMFGQHLKLDKPIISNMPPVGVQIWNNEDTLKFTQCHENEFACNKYGNCISMEKRYYDAYSFFSPSFFLLFLFSFSCSFFF